MSGTVTTLRVPLQPSAGQSGASAGAVRQPIRLVGTAILLLLAFLWAPRSAASGAPSDVDAGAVVWKTYVNVRFRYVLSYPAGLFVPQPEAPNADGRAFLGKDGARLIVYGSNNVPLQSLRSVLASTAARLAGPRGIVTYRVLRPHWFVVSGHNGPNVFYTKTFYDSDQFKSFELTYPTASSAIYAAVIPGLASGFRDLATERRGADRSDRDR